MIRQPHVRPSHRIFELNTQELSCRYPLCTAETNDLDDLPDPGAPQGRLRRAAEVTPDLAVNWIKYSTSTVSLVVMSRASVLLISSKYCEDFASFPWLTEGRHDISNSSTVLTHCSQLGTRHFDIFALSDHNPLGERGP